MNIIDKIKSLGFVYLNGTTKVYNVTEYNMRCIEREYINQQRYIAEEIIKWGIEPCYEHSSGGVFTKRECPICWQSLKERYGIDGITK